MKPTSKYDIGQEVWTIVLAKAREYQITKRIITGYKCLESFRYGGGIIEEYQVDEDYWKYETELYTKIEDAREEVKRRIRAGDFSYV